MILNFYYELLNYILFIKNPFKIIKKFNNNNNYIALKKVINDTIEVNPIYYQFNKIECKFNSLKLNIFNKELFFTSQTIWVNNNTDQEIYFYKVRFNWLLFNNEHLDTNLKIKLINHFIINNHNTNFDSYSISERISNLIIYLSAIELNIKSTEYINIKQYLKNEIIKLTKKLEFYGNKTNNHIISNNKAIFLYSLYFGENKYNNLCRKIFEFSCQHNFYSSGFLNEGSSQYHLLITKHLIEILYFDQKYKNVILNKKIKDFFYKIISNSYIFILSNYMPNLGDCTPDLPIQHLRNLPYIASRLFDIKFPLEFNEDNNFSNTYSNFFKLKKLKKPKLVDKNHFFYDNVSGYLLIVINKVMILMQLYNSNVIRARSHQHTELGNFILYYDGFPIILDRGRFNYQNSSLISIGAEFHNSIKINNIQPLICHKLNAVPALMNKEYFQTIPKFTIDKKNNDYNVEILFYGYKRYNFKSVVKRCFIISENFVKIEDFVQSKKKINYKSFFHFYDLNLNYINKKLKNSNKFENNLYSFEVLTDKCEVEFEKKFYSTEYSNKNKCISLQLYKRLNKIDHIEYIIKFK